MSLASDVLALDSSDPLADIRQEFLLPADTIYLDGNSLGPLSRQVQQRIHEVVNQQWGTDLIQSWNTHNWIDLPISIGEKIAPLIGAAAGQTICCDSISVNLFKLLSCALQLNPERKVVLSQQDNFPTDLYMAQGLQSMLGKSRCELKQVASDKLLESFNQDVAVLMLTHVNFRTGEMHAMRELTQHAQHKGVLVIWDLAHSAGALPVELDSCNVDFAVGCGYKYLNGGPGAPAFVYVAKRHQNRLKQPLTGWMGHQSPFAFEPDYKPAAGVQQFLAGTPSILSMTALDAALDIFKTVSIQQIRAKSIALSELFSELIRKTPELKNLSNVSPLNPHQRGSQIALRHVNALAISQALIDHKVIVDYRAPDLVRFGFAPMYTSFMDILNTVKVLSNIISSESFLNPKYQTASKVT